MGSRTKTKAAVSIQTFKMSTTQDQPERGADVFGFEDQGAADLYGRSDVRPLASSNFASWLHIEAGLTFDQCYPPRKHLSPVNDSDFASVFEESIFPGVLDLLRTRQLVPVMKELHAFRMGFPRPNPQPITIFFIFKHAGISIQDAKQIVRDVKAMIAKVWGREV